MNLSVDGKILGGFALALGAVVVTAVFAYVSTVRYVNTSRLVAHTHEVLAELEATRSDIFDAESGSRGYILTGRPAYRASCSAAIDLLSGHIAHLRGLTEDNPIQQRILDSLGPSISRKTGLLNRTIGLMDAQGPGAARELILSDSGRRETDGIRDLVSRMQQEENLLLTRRAEDREKSITGTLTTLSALFALVLCVFTLMYVFIRRDLAGRKAAELEMSRTHDLLDSIVEEVPAMIFMKDAADLRFVRFNKAGEDLTGYPRSDLLGKNDYDFFPREEADFFTSKDREVLKTQRVLDIPEEPIQTKHQGVRILHTRKIALRNERGEPEYLLGVSEDITDRKRSEAALRSAREDLELRIRERTAELLTTNDALQESESRYRILFESNPLPMWVYDSHTLAFLAVNNAAVQRYGYTREEFLSMTIKDIRPREEISRLLENLTQAPQEYENTGSWRHRKKDGSLIDVEITSHQLVFAGHQARLVLASDITDRKRAEEARSQFVAIVESSDDAIISKTLDGTITSWNPGAEELFGYSAGEAIGKPMLMLFPPDRVDEERHILAGLARGERINHFETVRMRKDGRRIHISTTISPIENERGDIVGASSIARDISDRISLEEERRRLYAEAQRLNEELEQRVAERTTQLEVANKELEAFSYSVSHDLRAPLRSIDGFSQAVLDDYADTLNEKGKEFLMRVRSAAQRMAQLIDDLLNLSRVSRAEMRSERVDLSAIARAITEELLRTEPERRVEVTISEGIVVEGDARLLHVALNNLLDNAWKYTSKQPQAKIEFGMTAGTPGPAYFVRDDGAGFDMAYVDKLFGAFQRLHGMSDFPGTGIGLATVQRIIHRHGGRVWAEGSVGKGATFYFTL